MSVPDLKGCLVGCVARQLLGVSCLHSRGYAHSDLWDQNAFNKQVVDTLAWDGRIARHGYGHYLQVFQRVLNGGISMDDAWMASLGWEKTPVPPPAPLGRYPPWYPANATLYWRHLLPVNTTAAGTAASSMGVPLPAAASPGEHLAVVPQWLVSMENSLGIKWRHHLYGETPPPSVLLLFIR